ncbi:MAG: amino acid adenylation domain-containing protein, partial [Cyanobacteria bacterium P01_A01_bin.84]
MKTTTLIEFISFLQNQGIDISTDGEKLFCDAPQGVLTPALGKEIAERKAEILKFLQQIGQVSNTNLPPIQARGDSEQLPLSWAQERLWFLNQLEGKSATYNIPAAVRISGNLNINALQQALSSIVQRHEVLRTSFQIANGTPIQVIDSEAIININLVDLQQLEIKEQETLVIEKAQHEATTPFDLENAPLIRCSLLQLSTSEYVLLLTMHHIVSDGWSMGVLIKEISSLYQAFTQGKPSPLAQLPIQYADFAVWQRQYLSGEVLSTQLDYWKQQLSGAPDLLQLPTDYPRPTVQAYQGRTRSFNLNTDLTTKLQTLSRDSGTTLFMTLYAAFSTLLYRYSGQSDILIGSPIANRNRSEIEALIGFFVNTLVLRTQFEDNPSFSELLVQVRETTLKAYEYQDVPFEQIVEVLQPKRSLSHSPLFQVMFVLQNAPIGKVELPGVTLSQLEQDTTVAKFDLTLSMTETDQGLVGEWEYNTDLFDKQTIERMVAHFQNLLEKIVENPSQKVGSLTLLSEAERHQLLVEWNDTATDYPKDKCIHQLFEEQVEKTPDAVAVVFEQEQLTYEQLNQKANQLAHHLQSLGVKPEVLVGICVERSIEMVVGLLGILKAGGAYVPLDPNYPQERLNYMLEDSDVGVLVTQNSLLESFPENNARVVYLDSDHDVIEQYSKQNLYAGVGSDNLAYVIYTSGSTGKPKGVLVTHKGLLNLVFWHQETFAISSSDIATQLAATAFDASAWELWPYLSAGATIHLLNTETIIQPKVLLDWLISEKITITFVPTPLLENLLSLEYPDKIALRIVLTGGDKLHQYQSTSLPFKVINNYGPTENTVVTTSGLVASVEETFQLAPAIGRPIANTQIYILDKHLQPLPVGVPGEIYVGGDGLARGYLNRPQLTQEKFIPNPFNNSQRLYKTGDLARYLSDGNIEFLGRIDNQVKIRGFRIELGEIEAVLATHPQVNQAVVIAQGENTGKKRLVAYVVKNDKITTQQVSNYIKAQLPDYMVPGVFVTLERLPLTPNGKIDRKALPETDTSLRETEYVASSTPREEIIASIFADVLGVENVGIHDNFFELGGHSLLATQLISRVRETFSMEIPLRELFSSPTVTQLDQTITQLRTSNGEESSTITLPTIVAKPENRYQPFPLTDIQQAYWLGRNQNFDLGNIATHGYIEIDCYNLNLVRFNQAWQKLIEHHDMLKAVILPLGEQQILEQVPAYSIEVLDLCSESSSVISQQLETVREQISHEVLPAEQWPLFKIRATILDEQKTRLHISSDALIADAWSMVLLGQKLQQLYENPETELPPLEISFRDYVVTELSLKETPQYKKAQEYWFNRNLPPAPELPFALHPSSIVKPEFKRHSARLEAEQWEKLKQRATKANLTSSALLLAAFADTLNYWSKSPNFTINLTLFNRFPFHPQVNQLVGDFTSLTLLEVDNNIPSSFTNRAQRLQQQLWQDLDHNYASGVEVQRELHRQRGSIQSMGVVFTSTLGLSSLIEDDSSSLNQLGEVVYSISQTPQVWLDHQISEENGALLFNWDVVEELFPSGLIEDMFASYCNWLEQLTDEDSAWSQTHPQLLPPQQQSSIVAVNDTDTPVEEETLHGLFCKQVRVSSQRTAVISPNKTLTYEQLNQLAVNLAQRLREQGANPNTLIAVIMEKGWEQIVAVLGILISGAAYLPISPEFPQERQQYLLS